MARTGSYWWAAMSVVLMAVGAVGPWAETLGARADGAQDEVVLALALVAGTTLVLLVVSGRWWIGPVPLLAGLAATVLTGNDIRDVRGLVPDASDRHITLEWGIYLALVGSASLVLSLAPLLIEARPALAGRRSLSQRQFAALAREHTPYLVTTRQASSLIVPTADRHLRKLFWAQGTKDELALGRATAALGRVGIDTRGTTFVDVGANIGQTTLAALRAGFGSAVALEPVAETFALLRANLALNRVDDRVHAVQVGLSDRTGREPIVLARDRLGSSRLPTDDEAGAEDLRENVTLVRLDDLVIDGTLDPEAIGLLWIDTEGHEGNVLRGADRALSQGFPVVVEFNSRVAAAERLAEVSSVLRERYACFLDVRHGGAAVLGGDGLARLAESALRRRRTIDILAFNARET